MEELRRQIGIALETAGLSCSDEQAALLARHLFLVMEKNKVVNLTRIVDAESASYLHVVDSLLLANALEGACAGTFLDVGTGAGYPGIPLAIVSGRPAVLVDSVAKKAAAVREFVNDLGLAGRVEVLPARIEDVGRERRGSCAAVVARAVAQTNVLVEYAAPLLRRGGRLIVAKARPSEDELEAGLRAAKICGLKMVSRETFELPEERGHREILSFERTGNPAIRLPRAVGMAQHHPLGV
ncbi:MAG: 16S rRNA (guanine(527)-N(7))-methyltransferase RsmG [Coriobacteriales bacterium]|nr:16S rRNA (guanine(527)-N(7))-methyltransferase RsmG [Coriobacteriales bacterium]